MKFDFDTWIDRRGTASFKWDANGTYYGRDDVIPMWVADMDFPCAPAVVDAVKDGAFLSIEDFSNRSKVNGTICTLMADLGLLPDLPKSNQLSLFDL